jgi:hypothetical protein
MTAMNEKIKMRQEPFEIEMLLPWHAAGTLSAPDAARIDEALSRDSELWKQYAAVGQECAETIRLNESLGSPSAHALQRLWAAIDGEPPRHRSAGQRSRNSGPKSQES